MKKDRFLTLTLVAGALITLITMGGCVPAGDSEGGAGGISGVLPFILIIVLIFGMFYFFMIRPVRQREKKHDEMVEQLERGDMVITAGGIYGQVESIDEDSVVLKVESGATIRVTKGGVLAQPER